MGLDNIFKVIHKKDYNLPDYDKNKSYANTLKEILDYINENNKYVDYNDEDAIETLMKCFNRNGVYTHPDLDSKVLSVQKFYGLARWFEKNYNIKNDEYLTLNIDIIRKLETFLNDLKNNKIEKIGNYVVDRDCYDCDWRIDEVLSTLGLIEHEILDGETVVYFHG